MFINCSKIQYIFKFISYQENVNRNTYLEKNICRYLWLFIFELQQKIIPILPKTDFIED